MLYTVYVCVCVRAHMPAGSLKGGGVSWVPAVYSTAQRSAVRNFYDQNGWVGYETAKRCGGGMGATQTQGGAERSVALSCWLLRACCLRAACTTPCVQAACICTMLRPGVWLVDAPAEWLGQPASCLAVLSPQHTHAIKSLCVRNLGHWCWNLGALQTLPPAFRCCKHMPACDGKCTHTYTRLGRMGIPNAASYLRTAFPDGIPLETALVGPTLLSQVCSG